MCGIAGWIAPAGEAADVEALRALARAIAHRGPDDRGEFLSPDGGVGLAHLRLSIIDLSAASHQPMVERERGLVLVYNGELYNFRELRTELEGLGQRFATSGDTEVVLRAFAAWGEGCFARFAGMFALAIWDERAERLWLARDATGMKPLYFHERRGGGVLFASEVKAFLELPGFSPEANRASLSQFLEFGYVFDGDATMLQGVRKVLPGEVIEVGRSGIRRRFRHFEPPPVERDDRRSGDDRAAELHDTLGRVVREHLIADVPVGLLLSGGIDSSLVAAYAARDARLTTVTMAFADSAVDEREPARRVAQFLGTDHHEVEIRPQEIADEIVDDAWIFDDLFADWGTVSTRILYRKFRGLGFKVALVGEGSDELFGGYPIFEQTEPEKGSGLFRQFRLYQRYAGQRFGSQFGAFRRILREYRRAVGGGLFEAIRRFEAERQLPNNYVMKVDKASMSVSLEARAPFLDRRIAGIAYRTPREWLLRDGENKWLLREVARRNGLLPPEISSRAKFGASIAASWIEQVPSFRDLARDVVLDRGGWVDELGLRPQMERFFAGESGDPWPRRYSVYNHLAWRLLLLNLWSERYLGREASGVAARAARRNETSGTSAFDKARMDGLVSVVIPVKDRATLLQEAVASVLAQDYRPIEVLVVDDGSKDETPAVIARLVSGNPGVVFGLVSGGGGPGVAREVGRRQARGEFIQYLDSDDLLLPGAIRARVEALASDPAAVAAYGASESQSVDGAIVLDPERPSNEPISRLFPRILVGRFWQTGAALFRSSVADLAGPWSSLWLEEDWEYDSRIAELDRAICFVPAPVVRVRDLGHLRQGSEKGTSPERMAQRSRSHQQILESARRAGITSSAPEMSRFARELFLIARQCGAAGLPVEARRLFWLARGASLPARSAGGDFRAFRLLASLVGWRGAGVATNLLDRIRFGGKSVAPP